MADIFISWSSPDGEIVRPVIKRLQEYGFNIDEFESDLDAGSVSARVQQYIENARLMVLFVSEKTQARPWLRREVEWAAFQQNAQKNRMCPVMKMIPILIGKVDLYALNSFLAEDQDQKRIFIPEPAKPSVNAADTGDVQPAERLAPDSVTEAALFNIVLRICNTVDIPKPIVVPVILLAMTRTEARQHLHDKSNSEMLHDICAAAGMPRFPWAYKMLLPRYGDTVDDFKAFAGSPLKMIVEETVSSLNSTRRRSQSHIWLWWCRDVLFGGPSPDRDYVIDRIERGRSLVILDSISAGFDRIRRQYSDVASLPKGSHQALLWVPPYTHHTSRLFEASIEKLLMDPPGLRSEFRHWGGNGPPPHVILDIPTALTLRAWLVGAWRVMAGDVDAASAASRTVWDSDNQGPVKPPI